MRFKFLGFGVCLLILPYWLLGIALKKLILHHHTKLKTDF